MIACIVIGAIAGGVVANGIAKSYGLSGDNLVLATILGATAGGLLGYFVTPIVTTLITSIGPIGGGLTFAGDLGFTGGIVIEGAAAITGTQVIGACALTAGITIMCARDKFVEFLKKGMTKNQQDQFQRAIEGLKKDTGRGGSDNLDKNILRAIAEWIKEMFK